MRNGYQPNTKSASARRADFDLQRRNAGLQERIVELERQMEIVRAAVVLSGHSSFSFSSNTTEPIVGNQVRLNNASQIVATRFWVSQTAFDGLDVSVALSRLRSGDSIYMQDYDNASTWVRYDITADPTDDGSYYDVPVVYAAGPANVPYQKVEVQLIFPNAI
jgi:hypothetical protein